MPSGVFLSLGAYFGPWVPKNKNKIKSQSEGVQSGVFRNCLWEFQKNTKNKPAAFGDHNPLNTNNFSVFNANFPKYIYKPEITMFWSLLEHLQNSSLRKWIQEGRDEEGGRGTRGDRESAKN